MEKIQSAIAKARAARSLGGTEALGDIAALSQVEVTPPVVAQPVAAKPAPVSVVSDHDQEVSRRWDSLLRLTIQPSLMEANRLPAFAGGPEATQFDMLRTRLLQQMAQNNWKRLAITSPGPSCGKSTLALNLAFALGRLPEQRVILAEVDLRRPSMQKLLGHRQPHSFSSVLAGRSPFAQNAMRHGNNLAFASNEMASRSAADALHGEGAAAVLDQIEADYAPSIMVFDMPPMLASDDALAFAGRVDCALILAAAETTSIKELDKCERELATQTNVLGVILNKCRYMDRHDSYDYY